MADLREKIRSPKPWETMGVFFGYFAVAKDAPSILRTLLIPRLVPKFLKSILLEYVPKPDFWLLIIFTVFIVLLYTWLLWRPIQKESPEKDRRDRAIDAMKKNQLLRIIRSLGIVLVRERILDFMSVFLYGTFRRQGSWGAAPERFQWVDRITYCDNSGIEIQYSRYFKHIFVRTHPATTDEYGESEFRKPNWKEIWLLLIASNFFPFWFLGHLFRRWL